MEQKLKNQIGELVFNIMVLQDQLEQSQAEIKQLKEENEKQLSGLLEQTA